MTAPQTRPYLTYEEYLSIEEDAPYKSEYLDGEMFAMAGTTLMHAIITANVVRELGLALDGGQCVTCSADLRIKDPDSDFAAYPDASVVCGPAEIVHGKGMALTNPTAIVEVLSDSTEAYDRGAKFVRYRQLKSLQVYVLVSQRAPLVEVYTRHPDESWRLTAMRELDGVVALPSFGISLAMNRIYYRVEFPSSGLGPIVPVD
jgi:Uma2 family endonuclease